MQTAERYSCFKPANSRWDNGWLISITSIGGFEMVHYPSDRPFVLSRAEWDALPEYRPSELVPDYAIDHPPYRGRWIDDINEAVS